MIWQGYPVLIVGTTDRAKQFHPFGLSVCINETQEDFAFIFKSLKSAVLYINAFDYQPTILIADASPAITHGFLEAFERLTHRIIAGHTV